METIGGLGGQRTLAAELRSCGAADLRPPYGLSQTSSNRYTSVAILSLIEIDRCS